jgi:hypothetical protein
VLNEEGVAIVEMPHYFEAINIDFSYNLTAIGAPAPGLYISKELADGKFEIAGGVAGQKISWQVTAQRNDPYVQQHPEKLEVEPMKPENRRGQYLHPELYGQPNSKRIIGKTMINDIVPLKESKEKQESSKSLSK